jgi:hypothetical protein
LSEATGNLDIFVYSKVEHKEIHSHIEYNKCGQNIVFEGFYEKWNIFQDQEEFK